MWPSRCALLCSSSPQSDAFVTTRNGDGGREGRITVQYHFTCPGPDITLFTRTMTIEAYRYAPLPDKYFMMVNPANIDAYHAAIARELAA